MTLFKQIILVLSIFQTIIFGAVMWFNFNSSKNYVQEQAYTDALHTANSLGLSISSVASADDVSMSETMINSVFDSGYYEKIILEDMNQNTLVDKNQKIVVADVPSWFIEHVKIETPIATSQIMLGWTPYGILSVQLNSGHAYLQLWTIFKEVLTIFVVVSIMGLFFLQFLLGLILKPLKRVREQAEAILENDFIFQKEIPFTTELKNVVFAMNSMIKKVKEIFDKEVDAVRKYHELLYQDTVTKMYNRRYFNIKLQEYLNSEENNASGALILLSLNDFEGLKNAIGYEKSEAFQKAIAESITVATQHNSAYLSAKLSDTDFAILVPGTTIETYTYLCDALMLAIKNKILLFELDEEACFMNMGYVQYTTLSTAKELFSKADFALTTSKAKKPFCIECFTEEEQGEVFLGKEAWAQELRSAMDEKRFKLAYQNAVNINDYTDVMHSELFVRLEDYNGYIHNAGHFMPMVMELKMGALMDHYVIGQAIAVLRSQSFTCKGLSINLGKDIFMQSNNWLWLEDSVASFKKAGDQMLYFEVQINAIPSEILIKFSKYLRSLGYGLGLDNFAINSENLTLMQLINPSYIKVQASALLDLLGDEHILDMPTRSLSILTDSMDINIIAVSVEEKYQRDQLEKLGIKYVQGSFIAPPKMIG